MFTECFLCVLGSSGAVSLYHQEKLREVDVFIPFEDVKTKIGECKQLCPGHVLMAKQRLTFSSVPLAGTHFP